MEMRRINESRTDEREAMGYLSCDVRLIEAPSPAPISDDQEAERAIVLDQPLELLHLGGAGEGSRHHRGRREESEGKAQGLECEARHDRMQIPGHYCFREGEENGGGGDLWNQRLGGERFYGIEGVARRGQRSE